MRLVHLALFTCALVRALPMKQDNMETRGIFPMSALSPETKRRVLAESKKGHDSRTIAKNLKLPKDAVSWFLKKNEQFQGKKRERKRELDAIWLDFRCLMEDESGVNINENQAYAFLAQKYRLSAEAIISIVNQFKRQNKIRIEKPRANITERRKMLEMFLMDDFDSRTISNVMGFPVHYVEAVLRNQQSSEVNDGSMGEGEEAADEESEEQQEIQDESQPMECEQSVHETTKIPEPASSSNEASKFPEFSVQGDSYEESDLIFDLNKYYDRINEWNFQHFDLNEQDEY